MGTPHSFYPCYYERGVPLGKKMKKTKKEKVEKAETEEKTEKN